MTQISRRSLLKTSAMAAAGVAMPAVLRAKDALATSGQVNVFAWGDYVQQNMIDKFQADTGITVNLSTYGSNDEAEQKLKASGGKGFDIIFPSVTNVPNYKTGDDYLLLEIDESRLPDAEVTVAVEYSTLNYKDGLCLGSGGGFVPRPIRPSGRTRSGSGRRRRAAR